MSIKKLIGIVAIALFLYFVITQPVTAGDKVVKIGHGLEHAATSVTKFFTRIT